MSYKYTGSTTPFNLDEARACGELREKAINNLADALIRKLEDSLYYEFEHDMATEEIVLKIRLDIVKPK